MSKIPPELLREVLSDIEEELGFPNEYAVPIQEIFDRLVAKGWDPEDEEGWDPEDEEPTRH